MAAGRRQSLVALTLMTLVLFIAGATLAATAGDLGPTGFATSKITPLLGRHQISPSYLFMMMTSTTVNRTHHPNDAVHLLCLLHSLRCSLLWGLRKTGKNMWYQRLLHCGLGSDNVRHLAGGGDVFPYRSGPC